MNRKEILLSKIEQYKNSNAHYQKEINVRNDSIEENNILIEFFEKELEKL